MRAADGEIGRLRAFWDARYRDFTLSESGWMGAGEGLNERIYACKVRALDRALLALSPARAGWTVLDAGCGQGYFARFYRDRFPSVTYVGIDISERAVAHLRRAVDGAEFHVADLANWTDPAGRTFDVIQSLEVLHLFMDDDVFVRALTNLSRQLAPGGAMVVTAALPETTVQPSDYLRYRSRRLWLEVLRSLGLSITSERPIYYWLPSGGPANKYLRFAVTRLGVHALYAVDRAALACGLPQPRSIGIDCTMRLLTVQRVSR